MRKTLTENEYTQINTNADKYMIQNISSRMVILVVSDIQPAADAPFDFVLYPNQVLSSSLINGIVWGRLPAPGECEISVVEG